MATSSGGMVSDPLAVMLLGQVLKLLLCCVDGDVRDNEGMRQNTPEEGDRAGTSLGVIREGDENGAGGRKWDGDGSLWDNDRRGLSGTGRGQGGGSFDMGGGLGDGSDSGRRSRTGGESGRRSASGMVRVSVEDHLGHSVLNYIHSCD